MKGGLGRLSAFQAAGQGGLGSSMGLQARCRSAYRVRTGRHQDSEFKKL